MSDIFHPGDGTAHATAARARKRGKPLVCSDYIILAGLWMALFITSDPFDWAFERPAGTKHVPLLLALIGLLIAATGSALRPRPSNVRSWPLWRAGFPLLLLGAWALAGGLKARLGDHIQDTFLTTGLYMLGALALAKAVMLCDSHERLITTVCRSIAAGAAFMIVRMAVRHDWSGGLYHELEFVIIPPAVYFALKPSAHPLRSRIASAFFLLGGIVVMKNTAFIVIGITLLYLFWADWRFRLRNPQALYRCIVAGTFMLGAAIVTVSVVGNVAPDVAMPTGNPGYRMRTYDRAIERFRASPVWGTLFATRTTARFTAFEIDVAGGQLPTHSDVLDIAANGGVIALGLLTWSYLRIARIARRTLLRVPVKSEIGAAAHMFACMSLAGIAVYAFNPIMLQPDKAMLLWGALGMLLGCCLHRNAPSTLTEAIRS